MEQLTHWKKRNDSRYISGEDLHSGLNNLRPEMAVVIDRFQDAETFDQQQNSKVMKTGLYLKELNGKDVYKPVILNTTNAKFLKNEFKSDYMEHWVGKPIVLYAQVDKRHGFVARFKKYYPPAVDDKAALAKLAECKTLAEVQDMWGKLSAEEKLLPAVVALKEKLKTTLK